MAYWVKHLPHMTRIQMPNTYVNVKSRWVQSSNTENAFVISTCENRDMAKVGSWGGRERGGSGKWKQGISRASWLAGLSHGQVWQCTLLIPKLGRQRSADLWVWGWPNLQNEFYDKQDYYTEKSSLEKKKNQTNK